MKKILLLCLIFISCARVHVIETNKLHVRPDVDYVVRIVVLQVAKDSASAMVSCTIELSKTDSFNVALPGIYRSTNKQGEIEVNGKELLRLCREHEATEESVAELIRIVNRSRNWKIVLK
ncbi:MAG: hypothetical protein V1707_03375 [bacterium]